MQSYALTLFTMSSPSQPDLQLVLDLLNLLREETAQDVGLAGELVQLGRLQATLLQDAVQTGQLLGDVVAVLAQLVEHADVVLGVLELGLLLQARGLLLRLLEGVGQWGRGAAELVDDGVERLDGARVRVQAAADGAVRAGLLVQERDEVRLAAATTVGLGLLGAGGEVLDGRVGADALRLGGSLAVIGLGIDLGNQDIGLVLVVLGELLPCGNELLAVCVWFPS